MTALERVEGIAGPAEVVVAIDLDALGEAAAERLTRSVAKAIVAHGAAHVALTGGSTAAALAKALLREPWVGLAAWEHVHLWWGDERLVPLDHADSNAGTAFRTLVFKGGLPVPVANIHPAPVDVAIAEGRDPDWIAASCATEIATTLPRRDGLPSFDLILLGMGPDGHILSAFPGGPWLDAGEKLVVAVPTPEHVGPHHPRITLNPRLLDAAAAILVMVTGAAKAATVRDVLLGPRDPRRLPAQLAVRESATWLLDREAAVELPAERQRQ